MKKKLLSKLLIFTLCVGAASFAACASKNQTSSEADTGVSTEVTVGESDASPASEDSQTVEEPTQAASGETFAQGGPYGEISVTLDGDWLLTAYRMDQEPAIDAGDYGFKLEQKESKRSLVISYFQSLGVCGTGLEVQQVEIKGRKAEKGTYDNHKVWDYIAFDGDYTGLVVTNLGGDEWTEDELKQIDKMLESIEFNTELKTGGAYEFTDESESEEAGVMLSLKNISSKGATVVFKQFDGAHSGDFGRYYFLEQLQGDKWVELEMKPDVAFEDIALLLNAGETAEDQVNFEAYYGELEPGTYRITKEIYVGEEGEQMQGYTLKAKFIVN